MKSSYNVSFRVFDTGRTGHFSVFSILH